MKKLITTVIILISLTVSAQQHKEVLKLNYNKEAGILSNKDYTFKCLSFHHQEEKFYLNEANYLKNVYDAKAVKDVYMYKYIVVKNMNNGAIEVMEYWKRKNGTVLVLYFEVSKNKGTI